jgi:hypothetical protein
MSNNWAKRLWSLLHFFLSTTESLTAQKKVYCPLRASLITGRPKEYMDAKKIFETIRAHWEIENGCHYILDWVYHEESVSS